MEKKGIWKKVLSVLFALGMAIVLLPGMRVTVKADGENTIKVMSKADDWQSDRYINSDKDLPGFKNCDKDLVKQMESLLPENGRGFIFYNVDESCWYGVSYANKEIHIDSQIRIVVSTMKIEDFWELMDQNGLVNYYTCSPSPEPEPAPSSETSSTPAPKPEQDQTLITGYIVNGKDANGNDTYATFSQENVWSVTKVTSNANSVTYDIKPQWETYGTVHVGIPALGFSDGAVLVDHYKNGKLIATYNGWVTWEWCEFDNPDGFSTFVIRKPGTTAQTTKRAYVPNTGVK